MIGALDIAVLGSSLHSTWGNGHATTWRALLCALRRRGHRVRFYQRECERYTENEDLPKDLAGCLHLYDSLDSLRQTCGRDIVDADVVMLGSFVPEGAAVADWLLRAARGIAAFYDIDAPLTLAKLGEGGCDYLRADQIGKFDLYLSSTGGSLLQRLRRSYGARARPLYCGVDANLYAASAADTEYDLGYAGTYSPDRQRLLRWYLLGVASAWPHGRFVVVGPKYPDNIVWPANVRRVEQLAPARHCAFYNAQEFTLHLTRADATSVGCSSGVRLFEAAACGLPVISDAWSGINEFFAPGKEILLAHEPGQVLDWLRRMPVTARRVIGAAARRRVLAEHTGDHRAETLERYIDRAVPRRIAMPVAQERVS